MTEVRIELGSFASKQEARRWLDRRVLAVDEAVTALTGSEPRAYGEVAGEDVWLGVARPGLVRGAQRLFRGRLEQHDGTWSLVGATQLGLSTRVRLAFVVVLGFVIVASRVVAPLQGTKLRPIDVIIGLAGVGVMLLPYAFLRSTVTKGTEDLAVLRDQLRRPEP
jgi:hypothetical protein